VRTVAKPWLAWAAPEVQTFWPVTSQPPSVRTPFVVMPAASEPALGSLKSWHQLISPTSLWRIQRACCSGVPFDASVWVIHPPMPSCG
jgi:hypothetical protein